MISNKNIPLAGAGFAICCHLAVAAEPPDAQNSGVQSAYVGSTSSIGIGYDPQTKFRGEARWVASEDDHSAWIGEGWVSGMAGGLKLNYHWTSSQKQEKTGNQNSYKVFVALDRNVQFDRKFTLGGGIENEDLFFGATFSTALSDRRALGDTTTMATNTLIGTESDGREYSYDVLTTTNLRLYERAYDFGFGMRVGSYFDRSLVRFSGGLDYEWGANSSHQATFSVGLEKFIANSPHSFSVSAEAYQKFGFLERNRDDQRINVMYRYEFGGKGYRPQREFRLVQARANSAPPSLQSNAAGPGSESVSDVAHASDHSGATSPAVSPKIEPGITKRIVKTTATMLSDAFFVFDSDVLTPEAKRALDPIVSILRDKAYAGNILLTGHTCDLGPDTYNLKLSKRRAQSVKKFLVATGDVPADVILTVGMGSSMPRFPNMIATRNKNRRVDLQFVTLTESLEDVAIPVEKIRTPAGQDAAKKVPENLVRPIAQVEWTREYIDNEPPWLRRALHNTMPHKQSVDVYRQQEREVKVTVSDKRYVNRAPNASNDAFSVNQDTTTLLDVLINDSDPDGNPLQIAAVTAPAHGSASVSAGKISYKSATGFVGVDTFSYTIADDKGATSSAQATITVKSTNRAPVAQNDAFSVNQDTTTLLDVLINDSDPDGNPLQIAAVTAPAHGSASVSAGKISYKPATGFVGVDTFSYTIADDKGATSSAQATITVKSTNHAPVAVDDTIFVSASSASRLNVLSNDSDPDGNALTIVSFTQPSVGSISQDGNGTLTFTPSGPFGATNFSYTVSDGQGGIARANVTLIDP